MVLTCPRTGLLGTQKLCALFLREQRSLQKKNIIFKHALEDNKDISTHTEIRVCQVTDIYTEPIDALFIR